MYNFARAMIRELKNLFGKLICTSTKVAVIRAFRAAASFDDNFATMVSHAKLLLFRDNIIIVCKLCAAAVSLASGNKRASDSSGCVIIFHHLHSFPLSLADVQVCIL